jgi:hypothetical protein
MDIERQIKSMLLMGVSYTDVFMIRRMEKQFPTLVFMLLDSRCKHSSVSNFLLSLLPYVEYREVLFKDYIVWNFDVKKERLEDEETFIESLNRYASFATRFVAAFVRIGGSHRNVLLVDLERNSCHYFEPNDICRKYASANGFGDQLQKWDAVRGYFERITARFPTTTIRWTNYHFQLYNLKKEHKLSQASIETAERGFCTGFCYFYVYQIVSGTIGCPWTMSECLSYASSLMEPDIEEIERIDRILRGSSTDIQELETCCTTIGTLVESRRINRIFALECPKEYRTRWLAEIQTVIFEAAVICIEYLFEEQPPGKSFS